MQLRVVLILVAGMALAAEPAGKPTPIDPKLTSAYWRAAYEVSRLQQVLDKANIEMQRTVEAIKASCAGEVQTSGEFVCVPKPEAKP